MAIFAALLPAAAPLLSQAKPAIVTFYTPGSIWKGSGRSAVTLGMGNKEAPSMGVIYDGPTILALMQPGKFVSFEVPAGAHTFTANMDRKKAHESEAVTSDLKPGEQYFLQLTTTSKGAYIVQIFTAHLAAVTCEAARAEADTAKPLDIRRVEKPLRDKVVNQAYFPRCGS